MLRAHRKKQIYRHLQAMVWMAHARDSRSWLLVAGSLVHDSGFSMVSVVTSISRQDQRINQCQPLPCCFFVGTCMAQNWCAPEPGFPINIRAMISGWKVPRFMDNPILPYCWRTPQLYHSRSLRNLTGPTETKRSGPLFGCTTSLFPAVQGILEPLVDHIARPYRTNIC